MRPEIGTASLESPRARHLRGGDRNRIATGAVNSGAHFFERFLFRDSLWNDALLGLAVAGTPWLIVCALNDWCYYNEYGAENLLRTTALTTAAIGAGVGALWDLSLKQKVVLYDRSRETGVRFDMSPALSRAGGVIRFTATF
jgi:hypothetical protein